MKVKIADLIGPALDWAVAKCLQPGYEEWRLIRWIEQEFTPTANWSQGGPIIERECIATYASGACSVPPKNPDYWVAEILETDGMRTAYGPTPLIAAMRCFVASRFGDEVEIPEELL